MFGFFSAVCAFIMGYTPAGIKAGSYAASMMSAEALASGGGVAAGGFTATMQSIGAMAGPVAAAIGTVIVIGLTLMM
jgi:hypothetical protein